MTNTSLTTTPQILGALAHARRTRSLEPIWSLPDVDQVVKSLSPHDLFTLVTRVGIQDSLELLSLATPVQLRSAMDFDCWNKDRVNLAKFLDWLSALSMLGFEKLGNTIAEADPELSALFLLKSTVVYNLKEVESPEWDHIPVYRTPDTYFEIYPHEGTDETTWMAVTDLLENLYRYDQDLARSVILDASWGTELHLEEEAYRWMKGRIEDEGFYDYLEALEIYKWIDPQSVTLGSPFVEPPVPGNLPALQPPEPILGEGPFREALQLLSDSERDLVTVSVVSLFNRMIAADRISPDDEDGLRETAALASSCLDLGVTFIAHNQPEAFPQVLREIAASRVFRVGYSLIHQLKGLAQTLSRSGHISLSPRTSTLLEGPWAAFYDALTKGHPRFAPALLGDDGVRNFRTLADVAAAGAIIEDLSMLKGLLFNGLGISPRLLSEEGLEGTNKPHPGQVTFGDLFRTWLLGHLARTAAPGRGVLTFDQCEDGFAAMEDFTEETLNLTVLTAIEHRMEKNTLRVPATLPRIVRSFTAPLFKDQHPRHLVIRKKK